MGFSTHSCCERLHATLSRLFFESGRRDRHPCPQRRAHVPRLAADDLATEARSAQGFVRVDDASHVRLHARYRRHAPEGRCRAHPVLSSEVRGMGTFMIDMDVPPAKAQLRAMPRARLEQIDLATIRKWGHSCMT